MPTSPLFKKTLGLLLIVAALEFLGAAVVFAPRLVSTVAGQLANKVKSHEALLPMQNKEESLLLFEKKHSEDLAPTKILSAPTPSHALVFSQQQRSTTVSREENTPSDASLALIDVQQASSNEGEHILKIAIKSRAQETIAIPYVKVQVYFYDEIDGEVVASKSPVDSRWLSLPDWNNGNPQLLEVTYRPDSNTPTARYAGYIVAVYYKGKLQGYRVDPPELSAHFPIKVDIGNTEL
ncbi:MAG: hypothetical protein K2W99_08250 [Chthoniobacterales bacterium]|nr:hypothetical protein [Chthoniobacterales bacterium]